MNDVGRTFIIIKKGAEMGLGPAPIILMLGSQTSWTRPKAITHRAHWYSTITNIKLLSEWWSCSVGEVLAIHAGTFPGPT